MSLFDDNFKLALLEADEEAEGAAKDAEEKEDDAPAEDGEGAEDEDIDMSAVEDLPDPDAETEEECKEALEVDIEASSLEEATGMSSILEAEEEEMHYSCLEAVSAAIMFDKADVACTEAYVNATSNYEKQVVTEKFTETVKKYAERFKQFLIKIKNAVVRIFSKVWNYIKIFAAKLNARFAKAMVIDTKKYQIPKGTKVEVFEAAWKADTPEAMGKGIVPKAATAFQNIMTLIDGVSKSTDDKGYTSLKKSLEKIKVPETDATVKEVLGNQKAKKIDITGQEATIKKRAGVLAKQITKYIKGIDQLKKSMDKCIDKAKKHIDKLGDIDTSKINILTAGINKAMSLYNRMVNAAVKVLLIWVNNNAKVIRAAGWAKEEKDKDDKKKKATESFGSIFAEYINMVD